MNKNKMLLVVGLAGLIVIAGLYVVLAEDSVLGSDRYRAICSGRVDVNFLGIGDPSFKDSPSCSLDKCGLLSISDTLAWGLPDAESGSVRMTVRSPAGSFVTADYDSWDSGFGGDPEYVVKSGCQSLPISGRVEVVSGGVVHDSEGFELR